MNAQTAHVTLEWGSRVKYRLMSMVTSRWLSVSGREYVWHLWQLRTRLSSLHLRCHRSVADRGHSSMYSKTSYRLIDSYRRRMETTSAQARHMSISSGCPSCLVVAYKLNFRAARKSVSYVRCRSDSLRPNSGLDDAKLLLDASISTILIINQYTRVVR